jgi:formate dehydrogenase major subunit
MYGRGRKARAGSDLRHPRCAFQVLRRHFSRYTPEAVAQICGCSSAGVMRVAELLARNSGRDSNRAARALLTEALPLAEP